MLPNRSHAIVDAPITTTEHLLTSWKEIAAYFGKGVRTVQRWERELGLPVRRPTGLRQIVFANPAELRDWLEHQTFRSTDRLEHDAALLRFDSEQHRRRPLSQEQSIDRMKDLAEKLYETTTIAAGKRRRAS